MKGLLLKDIYMASKYCRAFLFIIIIFIGTSFVESDNTFFMVYTVLMVSLIPMTLLSYDEREKWDKSCIMLPYSRAQIVSGKYLFGILATLSVVILDSAALAVSMFGNGTFAPERFLTTVSMLVIIGLIAPSFVMPFAFKFGTEKGRIAYYIVIIFVFAFGGIAGMQMSAGTRNHLLTRIFSNSGICGFAIGAMLVFGVSWWLSIRLYERREI
ncbi:MAG: ABC-2 transporter permease [Eubacteriales bacterium]|nr:ABC-2 transporter permease [Eubacteriales bacterium]